MRGHNICFLWEIRKIISELSPLLLLIWSSAKYQWHRLGGGGGGGTKPIPGIGYAEENFIWDSVVKICKTGCFPNENSIFDSK